MSRNTWSKSAFRTTALRPVVPRTIDERPGSARTSESTTVQRTVALQTSTVAQTVAADPRESLDHAFTAQVPSSWHGLRPSGKNRTHDESSRDGKLGSSASL